MTDDIPPEQILNERWCKPPDHNTKTDWVFLHVDVIWHSRLFQDDMGPAKLLASHNALHHLRDNVVKISIPDFSPEMEWDWAGDGGIFAFHANDQNVPTTEKVVMVAEKIRNKLRDENELQPVALRLEIRIVVTRGWAYYYSDEKLRCSQALNDAAKIRIPGDRTSIVITRAVLAELQDSVARQFRPIEPLGDDIGQPVYVYVPALRDALAAALNEEAQEGDPMQAAHYAYRLGVLNFGTGERHEAIANFSRAATLLQKEKNSHRYYHRTLRAFYHLWRELAERTPQALLALTDRNDRREYLRALAKDDALKKAFGARWQFLHEMEFCIEQLDILARQPVADPSGLTSMQMCLLLERFGFPRRWHGSPVARRLKRIKDELRVSEDPRNKNEDAWTMDKGCSLCTAVAASCLLLNKENVQRLIQWLLSKKGDRFCFRSPYVDSRVPKNQHALHYAASVLQALVDAGSSPDTIKDVVDVFFEASESTHPGDAKEPPAASAFPMPHWKTRPRDFPEDWRRYLHIPYFDFACYVFSTFARTIAAHHDDLKVIGLDDRRLKMLRAQLIIYAERLMDDARHGLIENDPGRLYAARASLGAFALGLLTDFPPTAFPPFEGVRQLIATVASKDDLDPIWERTTTIDSNFDRLWRLLDGWLLQWECALAAKERGRNLATVVAGLFPSLDSPKA